jgi:hypothetical protein
MDALSDLHNAVMDALSDLHNASIQSQIVMTYKN